MTPQLIYIVLTMLGLGIVLAKHGQPRTPYSFWFSLVDFGVVYSLLYWGGFFDGFWK